MKGKIFNEQEVQSILNGSKVMFREVIKPQPVETQEFINGKLAIVRKDGCFDVIRCPYQAGQKIFCKEVFYAESNGIRYFSEIWDRTRKWKPAQHMKQEHSRLTLLIKEIKVERLAGISEEDAIAEGCKAENWLVNTPDCYEHDGITATEDFAALWDETHKKPEEKFEANPWVWVISFEVVK
jgi:hypothetical protein